MTPVTFKNPRVSNRTLLVQPGELGMTLTWSADPPSLERKVVLHMVLSGGPGMAQVLVDNDPDRKAMEATPELEAVHKFRTQVLQNTMTGASVEMSQVRRIVAAQGLLQADKYDILTALHLLS